MRLIDADQLERDGWMLRREKKVANCIVSECKPVSEVPTCATCVACEKTPFAQGDIVENTNNNSFGIFVSAIDGTHAVQVLELCEKETRVFVTQLTALKKTGKHVNLRRLIVDAMANENLR